MSIYPIRTFGDPVLRTTAVDVVDDAESLERLVADMLETMYDAPGVGLAAPQIGVSKRVFVADIGEGPFVMINPDEAPMSTTWITGRVPLDELKAQHRAEYDEVGAGDGNEEGGQGQ